MNIYLRSLRAVRMNWQILLPSVSLFAIIIFFGSTLFVRGRQLMQEQIRQRLLSTVTAASMQFDGVWLDEIHSPEDMQNPTFQRIVQRLAFIKHRIPDVRYAYLMRATPTMGMLEFVADGDVLATFAQRDKNKNGLIDPDEEPSYPGDAYDATSVPAMHEAFSHPSVDSSVTIDQWGSFVSAYAPVLRGGSGTVAGILGIDMDARDYQTLSESIFSPVAFILLLLSNAAIAGYVVAVILQHRLGEWRKLDKERAGLMLLTFHQLGSPLAIFKWSVENLGDRLPGESLEDAVAQHVKDMQAGIKRMDSMLNDLKQAAQIQERTIVSCLVDGDLYTVIHDLVKMFDAQMKLEHRKPSLVLDQNLQMKLDPELVSDVLSQLLTNALTFSPKGSPITIRAIRRSRFVQMEVSDLGNGIAPEDKDRLFQKFTRGKDAGHYKPDGNGLGLFIAKGLVEKMGGKMWLESEQGRGATFFFTLPL